MGVFSENNLTSVSLTDSAHRIDEYAFASNQITHITLWDSAISIHPTAIEWNNVSTVYFSSNRPNALSPFNSNSVDTITYYLNASG
jgi:hypothetical protein